MIRIAALLFCSLLGVANLFSFSREETRNRVKYWLWKQDWPAAEQEAKAGLYTYPYDPWLAAWTGQALFEQNRDTEVPASLAQAKRLGQGDSELESYVVDRILVPWADLVRHRGTNPLGIYACALALYPHSREVWDKTAAALSRARRFSQALPFWRKILGRNDRETASPVLRQGLRDGLIQTWRADRVSALGYADLAFEHFPRDPDLIGPAVFVRMKLEGENATRKAVKALGTTGFEDLYEIRILLASDHPWQAVERLKEIADKHADDWSFLDGLGQTLEDQLDGLNYAGRVADPLYYQALDFHARAVKAWLATHDASVPFSLVPPLRGQFRVTQGAGGPSFHYGLHAHFSYDVTEAFGTPVYAVADGVVQEVTQGFPDRALDAPPDVWADGNRITIRHAGGFLSLYAHLKQNSALVKPGDPVKAGQEIAAQGNSGITLGSHLHFSLGNADGVSVPSLFPGLERRPEKGPGDWVPSDRLEPGFLYRPLSPPSEAGTGAARSGTERKSPSKTPAP